MEQTEWVERQSMDLPFEVFRSEYGGEDVIGVLCKDEKHLLAQKASALVSQVLHLGSLHKCADGPFGNCSQGLYMTYHSLTKQLAAGLGKSSRV